jgi:hypothetical protein
MKALIAAAVVFGVPGICVGLSSTSGTPSPRASAEPTHEVEAPVAVEIAAPALFRAYDANEVSADEAYKGKHLAVAGRVASIDKDLFDHIIVRLAGGNMFQTVDATMQPDQKAQAAGLRKGVSVTVLCVGNGKIMGPQLEDCVLQ